MKVHRIIPLASSNRSDVVESTKGATSALTVLLAHKSLIEGVFIGTQPLKTRLCAKLIYGDGEKWVSFVVSGSVHTLPVPVLVQAGEPVSLLISNSEGPDALVSARLLVSTDEGVAA